MKPFIVIFDDGEEYLALAKTSGYLMNERWKDHPYHKPITVTEAEWDDPKVSEILLRGGSDLKSYFNPNAK